MNALTLICQTMNTIEELFFIAILFIAVVLIIFLALFVIDFKKEISNNPSINDKSISTRNVSNNLSGFDGKSFAQQARKPTLASAGKSFSQAGAGISSQTKPQTTASQPQQQNNLQTNNK